MMILKNYISMEHVYFGTIFYKLCDIISCTYMDIWLGKDRTHTTADMMATLATVTHLAENVDAHGQIYLYMDNLFLSPDYYMI
jgi:hypothetical protein